MNMCAPNAVSEASVSMNMCAPNAVSEALVSMNIWGPNVASEACINFAQINVYHSVFSVSVNE